MISSVPCPTANHTSVQHFKIVNGYYSSSSSAPLLAPRSFPDPKSRDCGRAKSNSQDGNKNRSEFAKKPRQQQIMALPARLKMCYRADMKAGRDDRGDARGNGEDGNKSTGEFAKKRAVVGSFRYWL